MSAYSRDQDGALPSVTESFEQVRRAFKMADMEVHEARRDARAAQRAEEHARGTAEKLERQLRVARYELRLLVAFKDAAVDRHPDLEDILP